MQISQISSFKAMPKTNNSSPKYIVNPKFKNVGDTFTFGMNPEKVKPILTKINGISPTTQKLIDDVISKIPKGKDIRRQISKTELAIAEKLPDGNFKITITSPEGMEADSVDDIIITTKDGLFNIESIGRNNKKSHNIEYEGLNSEMFNHGLAMTLKEHFL